MLMEQSYLTSLFVHSFSNGSQSFEVTYREPNGSLLHGFVKPVNDGHYEVLIKEKDVIIHCTTDENGILSCQLNSRGNPPWVDGISKQVAKQLKTKTY